jgi:hypothetical protein
MDPIEPRRPTRAASGSIVLAILLAALIVAGTLVLIDMRRASRCEDYGRNVLTFYQRQADIEAASPEMVEVSHATLTASLLETVGYPPPGCELP